MPKRLQWPVEQMRMWYELDGMTLQQIGDLLGRHQKLVNKVAKKHGFALRRRGPKSGPGHTGWKGGRRPDKHGYILVWCPDHPHANHAGTVREHRLIAEKMLGRYLLPTEVVHHINDDPADNRPENLMVFENNGQHLKETLHGKCPKWSEDGKRRISEAVRRKRTRLKRTDEPSPLPSGAA